MDTRRTWAPIHIQNDFQALLDKLNAFRITFRKEKNGKVFDEIQGALEILTNLLYPDPETLSVSMNPDEVPNNAQGILIGVKNGIVAQLAALSNYKDGKENNVEFDNERIMIAGQLATLTTFCMFEINYLQQLASRKKFEKKVEEPEIGQPISNNLTIIEYSDDEEKNPNKTPLSSDVEELADILGSNDNNPFKVEKSILLDVEVEEGATKDNTDNIPEGTRQQPKPKKASSQTNLPVDIFADPRSLKTTEEVINQLTFCKQLLIDPNNPLTAEENEKLPNQIQRLENNLELRNKDLWVTPSREGMLKVVGMFNQDPKRSKTAFSIVKRTVNRSPALFTIGAVLEFIAVGMALMLLYNEFVNKPYGKTLNNLFHKDDTHLDHQTLLTMAFFLFGLELMGIAAIRANCSSSCSPSSKKSYELIENQPELPEAISPSVSRRFF